MRLKSAMADGVAEPAENELVLQAPSFIADSDKIDVDTSKGE